MKHGILILAGTALAAALAAGDPAKELQDGVASYMKVREEALEKVPKLKKEAEPEEIAAYQKAAAEAIRNARLQARQGDIFTQEVRQYVTRVVRGETAGKQGKGAREVIKQGNPAEEGSTPVQLKVNGPYPDKAPLSSVPPDVLLRLPTLPKSLEFRFVGRHIVLYDAGAALIVDYATNILP